MQGCSRFLLGPKDMKVTCSRSVHALGIFILRRTYRSKFCQRTLWNFCSGLCMSGNTVHVHRCATGLCYIWNTHNTSAHMQNLTPHMHQIVGNSMRQWGSTSFWPRPESRNYCGVGGQRKDLSLRCFLWVMFHFKHLTILIVDNVISFFNTLCFPVYFKGLFTLCCSCALR